MIANLIFRVLKLLPPEASHNTAIWLLSIMEWKDDMLWRFWVWRVIGRYKVKR